MNLQPMTVNEWKFWNDRENVIFRSQTAIGVYDSHPLVFAPGGAVKRRAITWKEMTASAGAYTNQDRVWLLPSANLPDGILPKPGDQIRDSTDVDWTIGEIGVGKFGNTYRCTCRALAIVHQLSQLGVLTRPDNSQDAAGRPANANYTTIGQTLCRVQPEDSEASAVFSRITTPRKFTAFLETPLVVNAKDVFTVTTYASYGGPITGTQAYTIRGFTNTDRIWDLTQLELELIA